MKQRDLYELKSRDEVKFREGVDEFVIVNGIKYIKTRHFERYNYRVMNTFTEFYYEVTSEIELDLLFGHIDHISAKLNDLRQSKTIQDYANRYNAITANS